MNTEKLGSGDSKLETSISYLLITGVIISLVLEVIGLIMLCITNHSLAVSQSQDVFINGNNFFTFIFQLFSGNYSQNTGLHLMTFGIIVLILTPFLRLVASVIYFGWEKNIKYVLITLFVLVVITLSLFFH
jgi:uncharacterized membrane protein